MMPNRPIRLHVLVIIIITIKIIINIIIIIIIIIIITYSSGLDTDVEQLSNTIFIVNVNSLKFPLTLIHSNSLC